MYKLDFLARAVFFSRRCRRSSLGRRSVESRDCVGLVGCGGEGASGEGQANRRRSSCSHTGSAAGGERSAGGDAPSRGLQPPSQYISQSMSSSSRSNVGS